MILIVELWLCHNQLDSFRLTGHDCRCLNCVGTNLASKFWFVKHVNEKSL